MLSQNDKGVFANSMKSVLGKETLTDEEKIEPVFSQQSIQTRMEMEHGLHQASAKLVEGTVTALVEGMSKIIADPDDDSEIDKEKRKPWKRPKPARTWDTQHRERVDIQRPLYKRQLLEFDRKLREMHAKGEMPGFVMHETITISRSRSVRSLATVHQAGSARDRKRIVAFAKKTTFIESSATYKFPVGNRRKKYKEKHNAT